MKKTTLLFSFLLVAFFHSFGQNNPVENLTSWQQYIMPNNYYSLTWEEPAAPHGELIGYNIYREDEFYRFVTETNIHHLYEGYNDYEFIYFNVESGQGFNAHVTAVYADGESDFIQTVYIYPPALKTTEFEKTKGALYPNPTSGLLHIGNENLNSILLFDVTGKPIKQFQPQPTIDLSEFSKGIYLVKLISADGILVDKIIVE